MIWSQVTEDLDKISSAGNVLPPHLRNDGDSSYLFFKNSVVNSKFKGSVNFTIGNKYFFSSYL